MEEPVFIKCEPGCVSNTVELNNTDCDVKLSTETEVKIEPEDILSEPLIKEELEIQDVKIEACDEGNDASGVSLNENQTLSARPEVPQTTFSSSQKKGKNPIQCNICGRRLSGKRCLKEHLLLHSGQKPHKCNDCGKTFAQATSLRAHELVHTGERSHICSICGSRFKFRSSLKFHELSHSKEKPYRCIECGKAFTMRPYLDRHMIVHNDNPFVKPHLCNTCGKTFSRRGALLKHYC